MVINCQYDNAGQFHNDISIVQSGEKYGMINTKGKYVIKPKYSYLTSFSDGYATFEKGDKRGYINEKGKEVIKAQYSAAFNFNNGLAIVRASGKYGIIDNKGNYIVSPQYDELRRLNNNLYSFSLDDFWGLIDGKGNELLSPTYDEISYAGEHDKKYAFEYDGKLGYLSEDGSVSISNKFMIPRCYGKRAVIYDQDSYSGVSDRFYDDGYAIVYTDDRKMAVIDSSGNILNNKEYYGLGGCITNYCEYDGCLNVLSESDKNCSQAHAESINACLKNTIEAALDLGVISEDIPSKHLIIRKINCSDTSSSDGITTTVLLSCSSYKTKGYAVVWYFTDTGECTVFWGHDEKNDLNVGASSTVSGSLQNDAKGMSLDDIYNIKGLEDKTIDKETRIHISTVQGMVKRIMYNNGETMPAVSDYDLLIIDEAHRGYILDKEMCEDEVLYRDQREYQSKYRAVIEYFNAIKIALTATPALQTTEIFGQPVFKYTYREAVIEGYLVDHDAPHELKTKLSSEGIHYKQGETVTIYDPVTGEITNSELIDDELDFDVDSFNRQVITEPFNRAVLEEIAKNIKDYFA